jgi:hypothetical protein
LANVWLNVAPDPSRSLLKAPSSAVTVWPALSAFVQVTVAPRGTVIAAGWKLKLAIETASPVASVAAAEGATDGAIETAIDGATEGGTEGATEGVDAATEAAAEGVDEEVPEQAAIVSTTAAVRAARRAWRILGPPGWTLVGSWPSAALDPNGTASQQAIRQAPGSVGGAAATVPARGEEGQEQRREDEQAGWRGSTIRRGGAES